jgi:hypothetical protein
MHNTYVVLYVQGTPTSAANVSADEGIRPESYSTRVIIRFRACVKPIIKSFSSQLKIFSRGIWYLSRIVFN